MKLLIINTHLTYSGWSEAKLNLAFMDLAKTFFVERGHQVAEGLAKEVLLAGDGRTRQDPAASMAPAAKCRERSS